MTESDENKTPQKCTDEPLFIPTLALALDVICAASIGICFICLNIKLGGILLWVFLLFGLIGLVTPFIAVVLGIIGLCAYKRIGKMGIAFSIVAIVLPIIAVLTVIILGASGIPLIRFM